jgi:plasmid stabilization system protein ParE
MRVRIAADAEADLEDIADFIALDNSVRAVSFVGELRKKAIAIGHAPRAYAACPDLGTDLRRAIHRSYLIVFRINSNRVEVLRVIHGARDVRKVVRGE